MANGVKVDELAFLESGTHGLLPCVTRPAAVGDIKRLYITTAGDNETLDVTAYNVLYFLPELNKDYYEGAAAFTGVPAVEDLSDAATPIPVMLDVSGITGNHNFTCGTDASNLGIWCYR